MDNIVRVVLYYPCSMVLRQILCQFTGSAAQTHCAQRPQFVSKKFLEEEIFAGTNFRELAFDRKNRKKLSASRKFPAIQYAKGLQRAIGPCSPTYKKLYIWASKWCQTTS